MFSRFLNVTLVAVFGFASFCHAATTEPSGQPSALVLHIASDPNNLPFSNERQEGFENKIAALIAKDLGAIIEYNWFAQRRGFFREAVKHGPSDIVMGVPAVDFERVLPTRPYYRSTYCFVYRKSSPWKIQNFDDPSLRKLEIGVPLVGDSKNTPPAQWLADRGIVDNIVGFSIYSDYRDANPASKMIDAVAKNDIDVAIAWGPIAGYFAPKESVPLTVVPITQPSKSSTPIAYDISIGVKRSNSQLRRQIDDVLIRRKSEIDRILDEYGVPRVPPTEPATPSRINDEKMSH